jgi:macrolide transport system ATP-binding/permease protein
MSGIPQDLHYAIRQLRKNPGFACTAILVLALGIAPCLAIFGFVDAALLKPIPYPDPGHLVHVTESVPLIPRANLSYPDYQDWKKLNTVFNGFDVFNGNGYLMQTPTGTEPIPGERVSAGFFRTLGITPMLGRDFYDGEDLAAAPPTALLTFNAWQKRFGGRKSVVGETVALSGVAHTIIGVLPENFQFAPSGNAEVWTALHADGPCDLRRSCHGLYGIARLKPGITVEMARANMQAIAKQLETQYPDSNRGQGASVVPLSEVIVGDVRAIFLTLLGGAGLLLLIACINVSSLLLVRTESRKREIAVRGALGASRARLIGQFVIEGALLVVIASMLGVAVASFFMQLLLRALSKEFLDYMPYLRGLGLNPHMLAFAFAIAVMAVVLFSLTPILRSPLSKMQEGLAEGGRGSAGTLWRRFGANLVAVELAIAFILLVGGGLLGKSLYRLLHVELGFQSDHLATLTVALSKTGYSNDEQIVAATRQIIARAQSLPGVESAGTSSVLPVSFNGNTTWIRFVGKPYNGEHNEVNERDVSSAFFTTIRAKLASGRYFTDAEDGSKPHVVMINQTLAKRYFPGEDPIGKKIGDTALSPTSIVEVVGVVEDVKDGSLDSEIWPAIYYPCNQSTDTYFSLVVRTSQAAETLLPTLDAAVRQIGPGIGTMDELTMPQRIENSQTAYMHRSSAWLVGGFAALALLLGVVGLYSVIAYSVSQRTREIGVRMALGAQRASVYQLIMKEAAWLTGLGIAVGLVCSIAITMLIRGLLFGVQSWDVTTLAAVSGVLAVSALFASYIPARRAAKVDPMVALRYE